jgi:elongation factor Ts
LRNGLRRSRRRVSATRQRRRHAHRLPAEPRYVSRDEVNTETLDKEREIARAQAKNDPKNANKPDQVIDKIVEGRLNKFYEEFVLLDQPFIKDPAQTVGELVTEKIAKTGEKVTIRRFCSLQNGRRSEQTRRRFPG